MTTSQPPDGEPRARERAVRVHSLSGVAGTGRVKPAAAGRKRCRQRGRDGAPVEPEQREQRARREVSEPTERKLHLRSHFADGLVTDVDLRA
jgi:hypothetical protein